MTFWPISGRPRRITIALIAAAVFLSLIIIWEGYTYLNRANSKVVTWENIEINVPRTFPAPVRETDNGIRVLSFSVLDHENAGKYIHFFEFDSSEGKIDWKSRLPGHDYKLGKSKKEDLTVSGNKAVLTTTGMITTYPCGITQKTKVLSAQFYCKENKRYVTVLTYTTNREAFINILESLKCS